MNISHYSTTRYTIKSRDKKTQTLNAYEKYAMLRLSLRKVARWITEPLHPAY